MQTVSDVHDESTNHWFDRDHIIDHEEKSTRRGVPGV